MPTVFPEAEVKERETCSLILRFWGCVISASNCVAIPMSHNTEVLLDGFLYFSYYKMFHLSSHENIQKQTDLHMC